MEIYIIKRYLSPIKEGIYLNKQQAEIECNRLNRKCIVKPMWYIRTVKVIE